MLGDPAQAIFEFSAREAGAGTTSAGYWEQLRIRYRGELLEVPLEENHRSTADLAAFGQKLRAVLTSDDAPATKLAAVRRLMQELPVDEEELGPSWIQRGDQGSYAILTRTNGEALSWHGSLSGMTTQVQVCRSTCRSPAPPPARPPGSPCCLAPCGRGRFHARSSRGSTRPPRNAWVPLR